MESLKTGTWISSAADIKQALRYLEFFHRERFGNYVMLRCRKGDPDDWAKFADYCRKNKIHFCLIDTQPRGLLCESRISEEVIEKLRKRGKGYFLGDCLGEPDGMACWHQQGADVLRSRGGALPRAKNLLEAKNNYVRYLRRKVAFNRSIGMPSTLAVGGAPFHSYEYEAGVEICLTEMVPDHPQMSLAEVRGAAKAYGKRWGAHIAHYGYSGLISEDPLKLKRFDLALYEAFMAGAEFDYLETGALVAHWRGEDSAAQKRLPRWYRNRLRSFHEFAKSHPRPACGPVVKFAVMRGHLDGWHGDEFGNAAVWGQQNRKGWSYGDAERGWRYLDIINRKANWHYPYLVGQQDVSGHFPLGQYDIIPPETALDKMKGYSCIIFLGRNSMTPAMYRKLKSYVRAGGRLLMSVSQLSTSLSPRQKVEPIRNGDVGDLFGCRIIGKGKALDMGIRFQKQSALRNWYFPVTGEKEGALDAMCANGPITYAEIETRTAQPIAFADSTCFSHRPATTDHPILVENKLGKGVACLITTWDYPGKAGMQEFMELVLRAVLVGQQEHIRLIGSDRLRWAVYVGDKRGKPGEARTTIYLLNTDFDNAQRCKLICDGKKPIPLSVKSCGFKIMTMRNGRVLKVEQA